MFVIKDSYADIRTSKTVIIDVFYNDFIQLTLRITLSISD